MVYTSGIRLSETDTLETMQHNKVDLVCQKIHLKAGDRMLDIGCGWGTLAIRATKLYGVSRKPMHRNRCRPRSNDAHMLTAPSPRPFE